MTKTVFNQKDVDFTKQPMFFGEDGGVQRYDQFKYPQFDKLNQTMIGTDLSLLLVMNFFTIWKVMTIIKIGLLLVLIFRKLIFLHQQFITNIFLTILMENGYLLILWYLRLLSK